MLRKPATSIPFFISLITCFSVCSAQHRTSAFPTFQRLYCEEAYEEANFVWYVLNCDERTFERNIDDFFDYILHQGAGSSCHIHLFQEKLEGPDNGTNLGMNQKAKKGHAEFRAPFGCVFVEGLLRIQEADAEIVRAMFRDRASGMPVRKVASKYGVSYPSAR